MKMKRPSFGFLNRLYCTTWLAVGAATAASAATPLDSWEAADLSATHADGAAVATWASKGGRASLPVSTAPVFAASATPTGKPAVRFNNSLMKTSGTDSPAAGRTSFSVAYVFKASAAGAGTVQQWYNNTGIVDAEEAGAAADWGTALNSLGGVCLGIGNADVTIYASGNSVLDGGYHVLVGTWGAGLATVYLDNNAPVSTAAATAARDASPVAFGGLQTAANALFAGDITEIQFYGESLASGDVASLVTTLAAKYGVSLGAIIMTQQPVARQVYTGRPFELIASATPNPTYQWYKDGAPLPNAMSRVYSVSSAALGDAGDYQLVATASGGGSSVTSSVAHVTVTAPIPVTSGLAGYWKLDETSGTTAEDASGGGHPGTVLNNAGDQWTRGQVGGAMTFRGPAANDYIAVTNLPMPAGNTFSLAFWVYRDPSMLLSDAWRMIYFSGAAGFPDGPFSCRDNADGSGRVRPGVYQTNGTLIAVADPLPLPVSTWTHYVMLADGSSLRVYRNGLQVASTTYDGTLKKPVQPSTALTIGGFMNNGGLAAKFWQGKFDDIGYWTRPLSADEVHLVYAAGANGRSMGDVNLEAGAYATNWVAYNDLNSKSGAGTVVLPDPGVNNGWGTAPFVTQYNEELVDTWGTGGPLTNYPVGFYPAGHGLLAQMLVTPLNGNSPFGTPATINYPFPNTPAYDLFHGIVDLGNNGSGVGMGAGQSVTLTFTNLDPTMRYAFRATTVRNGATVGTHDRRWTYVEIRGATSFVDASTPGCLTAATVLPGLTLLPGQVAFQSGINTNGDVVAWEDIVPSANGTFSIVQGPYAGVITNIYGTLPPGTTVSTATANLGYVLAGIQVSEYGTLSPITFVSEPPASNGVLQSRSLLVSAKVAGTAPNYQWYKQGLGAVGGATAPSISFPSAQFADAGIYYLVAGNSFGSVTSSLAQVFVVVDTNAPTFVYATCYPTYDVNSKAGSLNRIIVEVDEPLDPVTAGNPGNWSIQAVDSGTPLAVQSVVLANNNQDAYLITDEQASGASYRITAHAVTDPAGNAITDTTLFSAWVSSPLNGVEWDYWKTGVDATLNTLTNLARFPNAPDAVTNLWAFDSRIIFPDDTHEQYGDRMRGFFVPPVSGNYTFYFRSDDAAQLYLNPAGEDPAGKIMILNETGCCADWNGFISPSFHLRVGKAYYIEGLNAENGGGDYLKVGVRLTSQGPPPTGLANNIVDTNSLTGPAICYPFAPKDVGGPIYVYQAPADTTALQNNYVIFSVAASNAMHWAMTYQWTINGLDVPGATNTTYEFVPALTDDQSRIAVRISKLGSVVVTPDALLAVQPDLVPPTIVAVHGTKYMTNVLVTYSKPMDPGSAQELFNYWFTGNLNPISAVLDATGTNVLLTFDTPMLAGGRYDLTVLYVSDLSGNQLDQATVNFPAWAYSPGLVLFEYFKTEASGCLTPVSALTSNAKYIANQPDMTTFLGAMDSRLIFPASTDSLPSHDDYGARFSGVFVPPADGNWIFYISSDDAGELWLNPMGADEAGLQLIAQETACCRGFAVNFSAPIALAAGQRYAIMGLYKEGCGGDFGKYAAKLETDPTDPNLLSPIPGSLLQVLLDPGNSTLLITQQPPTHIVVADPAVAPAYDFSKVSGNFSVWNQSRVPGPWVWDNLNFWTCHFDTGCNGPSTSALRTPTIAMTNDGSVTLTFAHRHSFEADTTLWDGGQVQISVNGGPFVVVPTSAFTANGYNGTIAGSTLLADRSGFTGDSAGYDSRTLITSTAVLGPFNAGDKIQVQFIASWDDCSEAKEPNWQIASMALSSGLVLPAGNISLTVGVESTYIGAPNFMYSYQWQEDSGAGFVDLPSQRSATLFISPVLAGNAPKFRCIIYSPGAVATTDVAQVTVTLPVNMVYSGGSAQLSWSAGAGYELQKATTLAPPADWQTIPANRYTYSGATVTFLETAVGNGYYRLIRP